MMLQKTKRALIVAALVVWDIVTTTAAIFIDFRICYPGTYHDKGIWYNPMTWVPKDVFVSNTFTLVAVACLAVILLNIIFGNYTSVMRHFGLEEMIRVLAASAVFSVAVFAICEFGDYFSTGFVFVLAFMIVILQMAGRSIGRLQKEIAAMMNTTAKFNDPETIRTLIYGAGEAGAYFCNKCKMDKKSRFLPVVFIDDDKELLNQKIHGVKIFGNSSRLSEAIKRYDIDEVIVAIPTASIDSLKYATDVCKENKCRIRRFGSVDSIELSKATVTQIDIEELLRRDSVKLNMSVVRAFVENKVVVVTGGAGSIGSEICRQVLRFGCKHLVVFDIHENGLYEIENELMQKYSGRFSLRLGSVRDPKRLDEVFDEFSPAVIFHAAAHKHVPMMEYSPKEAIKNNVRGTVNVAMAAIMHKCEKFILISTDKAVNPTNIMGASKRIAEKAIQLLDTMSDTDMAAVRFGNVLGSNGSVVPLFRKQIESGGPVTVTHKEMKRYFMTIPEAVQLVLEAGAMANGGEIFVLNMGEPVRIYDLACDLIRLSGHEPNVDIKIKFSGLRPGEKLFEEISMKDEDVTKTPNDKIFIMKPIPFDATELAEQMKVLEKSSLDDSAEDMFKIVKELVPTFNHNNKD